MLVVGIWHIKEDSFYLLENIIDYTTLTSGQNEYGLYACKSENGIGRIYVSLVHSDKSKMQLLKRHYPDLLKCIEEAERGGSEILCIDPDYEHINPNLPVYKPFDPYEEDDVDY